MSRWLYQSQDFGLTPDLYPNESQTANIALKLSNNFSRITHKFEAALKIDLISHIFYRFFNFSKH